MGFLTDHVTWWIAIGLALLAVLVFPKRQELLMPATGRRWLDRIRWRRRRREAEEAGDREATGFLAVLHDEDVPGGGRHRRGLTETPPEGMPAAGVMSVRDGDARYPNVRAFWHEPGAGIAVRPPSAPEDEPDDPARPGDPPRPGEVHTGPPTVVRNMLSETGPEFDEYLRKLPKFGERDD